MFCASIEIVANKRLKSIPIVLYTSGGGQYNKNNEEEEENNPANSNSSVSGILKYYESDEPKVGEKVFL